MKIYLQLGIVVFVLCSCSAKKNLNINFFEENEKQIWINSFKYQVFYGCLVESAKNDSIFLILKNKDLLSKSLELDFEMIDSARKLGAKFVSKIPKPFIKFEPENVNKNFYCYECLRYYASKDLDVIARNKYKKFLKSKLLELH